MLENGLSHNTELCSGTQHWPAVEGWTQDLVSSAEKQEDFDLLQLLCWCKVRMMGHI